MHTRTGKHVWFELALGADAAPVADSDPPARAAVSLVTAQVASLTAGPDGLITGWGGDAERMFGWTAEQVIGRPLAELAGLDGDSVPLHEHTMAHGRWYGSLTVHHVDGETIQVYGVHLAADGDDEGIACLWTRQDSRALLEPPIVAAPRTAVDGPGPRAGLGRLLGLSDSSCRG
jgi:PAS domain S-box-containing protein